MVFGAFSPARLPNLFFLETEGSLDMTPMSKDSIGTISASFPYFIAWMLGALAAEG